MPRSKTLDRAKRQAIARRQNLAVRKVEDAYTRQLRNVVRSMHRAFEELLFPKLEDVAKEAVRKDERNATPSDTLRLDVNKWSGTIRALETIISAKVGEHVKKAFGPTAEALLVTTKKNQRELIGIDPTKGDAVLERLVSKARNENIGLVEKAGRIYARQVREIFEDPGAGSKRVETLKAELLERAQVSESRAELIARDQVLKLNGALTKARQERVGIERYVWSTSQDERVRPEHAALEGQVFSWDSPPDVGHPGEDYQCRCVAIPITPEFDGPEED